jgi:hypothetical protein
MGVKEGDGKGDACDGEGAMKSVEGGGVRVIEGGIGWVGVCTVCT